MFSMTLRFFEAGLLPCGLCVGAFVGSMAATAIAETSPPPNGSTVQARQNAQNLWQLFRNDQPYTICGGGGQEQLDLFTELGGNSIRTWGSSDLEECDNHGDDLMKRAHQRGLTVIAGIWIGHPRHGFDYSNPVQVEAQRKHVREMVRRYKDRPALLLWGLGNEVEMAQTVEDYPQIFSELNVLAGIVKEEDPHHPVMTAISGAAPEKIQAIREHYPQLDILGINAYGSARHTARKVKRAGWEGPYILSEFGVNGPWERPKTSWDVPIEPTPNERMEMYQSAYEANIASPQCIGLYPFRWGSKQEFTATWFGLLLPSGERTPPVDYFSRKWTGEWPENRCPVIEEMRSEIENRVIQPGTEDKIRLDLSDPEGDDLVLSGWVMEESNDTKIGGDVEAVPPHVDGCFEPSGRKTLSFTAPEKPGNYRAFIKVSDENGGACVYPFSFRVE